MINPSSLRVFESKTFCYVDCYIDELARAWFDAPELYDFLKGEPVIVIANPRVTIGSGKDLIVYVLGAHAFGWVPERSLMSVT